jgi:hypothetical protein
MRLYAGSSQQFVIDTTQNQIADKLMNAHGANGFFRFSMVIAKRPVSTTNQPRPCARRLDQSTIKVIVALRRKKYGKVAGNGLVVRGPWTVRNFSSRADALWGQV